MSQRITGIVRDLLGPGVSDQTIRDCTMSVAGQCCFYRHAQEMIRRLHPELGHTPQDIEHLTEHITRFSLAAIAAYRPAAGQGNAT